MKQRLLESVSPTSSPNNIEEKASRVSHEIAAAFAGGAKLAADNLRRQMTAVVANARLNPVFARNLLEGRVAPSEVPFLTSREMATEERKAELDRLAETDRFRALSVSTANPTGTCPRCCKLSAYTFSCRAPAGNGGSKAVDAVHYTCTDPECKYEGTQI